MAIKNIYHEFDNVTFWAENCYAGLILLGYDNFEGKARFKSQQ